MAAVTITCSMIIVSPIVSSIKPWWVWGCATMAALKMFWKCSEHGWTLFCFCFFSGGRSPQERLTWYTQSVCVQTPHSTSTCLLSTRWLAPFCSGQLSARRWPIWQSSSSVDPVQTSYLYAPPRNATDTCCISTAPATHATWRSPGETMDLPRSRPSDGKAKCT